jgi:hypothetical protein
MALLVLFYMLPLNKRALKEPNRKGSSFMLDLSLDSNVYSLLNSSINPENSVLKSSASHTIEGGEREFVTARELLETLRRLS